MEGVTEEGGYPYLCRERALGFRFSRHVTAELPRERRCRVSSRSGLPLEKWPIRAFLPGQARRCFENRFLQENGATQETNRAQNFSPDASQGSPGNQTRPV